MSRERVIKYCDLWDDNERVKTVGFVMFHIGERYCDIRICIQGLHPTDSFPKKCYLMADSKKEELGTLEMQEGRGRLALQQLSIENLKDTGIAYAELESIVIPLSAHRQVLCVMGEKRQGVQGEILDRPEAVALPEEVEPNREESVRREEAKRERAEAEEAETDGAEAEEAEYEGAEKEVKEAQIEQTGKGVTEPRRQQMAEDKWKQLSRIYRHVKPFGDGREFLSVGLSDFVLFSEKDYCLVNNSFLLHGFYNYRHLVLGKRVEQGQIQYFLGVPGVFYDEEVRAALYFGFQSFMGKTKNSGPGEFGYYVKQIAL